MAARHMRAGLLALGWTEHDQQPDLGGVPGELHALAARLLMSLAHVEAEQGRTEYGLRLLEQAEPLTAPGDRGVLLLQRGLLFVRTWRGRDALRLLDEAVVLLADYPDPSYLARTLLNRALSHLYAGDVRRAQPDLVWCERVAAEHGLDLIAAKARHNRGYGDMLSGDLPSALQLFDTAADSYRLCAPSALPVLAMDKSRTLLAAGLADDAARELDGAIAAFRRQRLDQDLAEAELARSQAALALGDLAAAQRWATAARQRSRRRDNQALACLADLARLRARARSARRPRLIAAEAVRLGEQLRDCGLRGDADTAELIAARALLAAGRPAEAQPRIAGVRRAGPGTSLDVSLLRRLARAELAQAQRRPGQALAELRTGLNLVHTRRGRLGSLDLQTGTAALGTDLARAGLRLALERGSARLVFSWLERSRAQAFQVPPVRPPADPQAAAVLAELRQLNYVIRTAELNGQRDPARLARRSELQREIRERSWHAGGFGETLVPARLAEVQAALGETGQDLVALLSRDGRLVACVVRAAGVRLVPLGRAAAAAEAARRLTADLDTLAGRALPDRLGAVVRDSVRQQTAALNAEIIAPLRDCTGDGGLVLTPPGVLAGVPWGLLPDLSHRPLTVSPSASVWLAARQRRQPRDGAGPAAGPLLVAGPDLQHAEQEIAQIAQVYPDSQQLTGKDATVDTVLRALDGAPLAHLAAHGHHDLGNVLFSRLDLADGPLMAHDVQGLTSAPRQVVLSSCDVGRTVVRPGEEVLGFSAALLYAGTATVIASVARVADEASVRVMTAYHRALQAGSRPAEALAQAARAEPLSPFICFGSG